MTTWAPPVRRPGARLRLGTPGDRHEREADRVAPRVGGPGPVVPRPGAVTAHDATQGEVAPDVERDIGGARGGGRALPRDVRAAMEALLGADLAAVRLHTDTRADRLNRRLQARAFTTGSDVFFRRGTSPSDPSTLAHELTHVVQQQGAPAGEAPVQRMLVPGTDGLLHEDWRPPIGWALDRQGNWVQPPPAHVGLPYVPPWRYAPPPLVPQMPTPMPSVTPPPSTTTTTTTTTAPPPPPTTTTTTTTTAPTTAPAPAPTGPPPREWHSPGGTTSLYFSPGRRPHRKGPKAQGKYGAKTRRKAAGYDNPDQFATEMLPLWAQASLSPIPPGLTGKKLRQHFQDPQRRFTVTSPGGTTNKTIQGYKDLGTKRSRVVLGHKPSAGTHYNTGGHRQARSDNLRHNKSLGAYHALEDATASSASGAQEPRYGSPGPHVGSHPTFYDSSLPTFTGGPWSTYVPESSPRMLTYFQMKLHAASASPTAATDPDYLRAVAVLAALRTTYTTAGQDELLAIIDRKRW